MKNMYKLYNAQCPVCKRTDGRVQLVYTPLGHGRYCEYLCCECLVVFPWGSNKFGDITSIEQIKEVRDVENAILNEGHNIIRVEDHPNFQPERFCDICKKNITTESRFRKNGKWFCSPSCK